MGLLDAFRTLFRPRPDPAFEAWFALFVEDVRAKKEKGVIFRWIAKGYYRNNMRPDQAADQFIQDGKFSHW